MYYIYTDVHNLAINKHNVMYPCNVNINILKNTISAILIGSHPINIANIPAQK